MTVQVALVGEQPLSNLLPAFFLKPQEILLVYSRYTEEMFQRLKALMEEGAICVRGLQCQDAYETVSITQELWRELDLHSTDDEIMFNLTGGTKAMVLAAYQCASKRRDRVMYLESGSGVNRLFQYQFKDGDLQLFATVEIPPVLTLDQFLDAHLGKGRWTEKGYSKDIGGNFERAVGQALQGAVDELKAGVHFLGVEGKREQADLDLVIRVGNQFGVVEVKDQKKAPLDALKQLHYLSMLLGTYTKKFWVLSREPNQEHQSVIQATRTIVIDLPGFAGGDLDIESQQKLNERVLKAFGA